MHALIHSSIHHSTHAKNIGIWLYISSDTDTLNSCTDTDIVCIGISTALVSKSGNLLAGLLLD